MATKEQFSVIGRSNVRRSKAHERSVAKYLTEWSGVPFRRRRAEGRGELVVEVEGAADVIAVGADCIFSIEAKCGTGFSLDHLLADPPAALFTEWHHQSSYDAAIMSASRQRPVYPMIFFRPYSGANWVAFPVEVALVLRPKKLIKSTAITL